MSSTARVEEDPVPHSIEVAEKWRKAGEDLRREDPEAFEKLLRYAAAKSLLALEDRRAEMERSLPFITESNFLT